MSSNMQKLILAAAAFLVVFGGLCVAAYSQYNEKEKTLAVVQQLHDEIAIYDAKIATREEKRKHKEAIEDNFNELVEILPQATPRQKDKILEALTAYAAQAKMKFIRLVQDPTMLGSTAPAPGQPQPPQPPPGAQAKPFGDAFEQTVLTVQYSGTFQNFMKFLNLIEVNPLTGNFLRVDEVGLEPDKSDAVEPRNANITIKVSTFHYVVR
jgi:hypothetical protein